MKAAKPVTAASVRPLDPAQLAASNINPATLLASDYLNRFTEPVMLLDLVGTAPEWLEHLMAWRPATYREHFAVSAQRHRDVIITAYDKADPRLRRRLDDLADAMTTILLTTRDALGDDPRLAERSKVAAQAAARVRRLIARASALIDGRDVNPTTRRSGTGQAAIDALLKD